MQVDKETFKGSFNRSKIEQMQVEQKSSERFIPRGTIDLSGDTEETKV